MLSICGIKSNFSVAILILVKSSASFIFPLNTIALNTCNPPIKFVFPDEFGPYITDDDNAFSSLLFAFSFNKLYSKSFIF